MKTTFRKVMRASLIVALALLMTLSANFTAYAAIWYPANITALGDSITVAYDASGFGSQPIYSWSTGTSKSVNSMYLRLMAVKRTIRGHATNLAVPGATVADLNSQASRVDTRSQYVTIMIGANDVCASSEATMTDATTFRSRLDTALQTLTTRAPRAKIYILSIPDIYNLWSVLKDNSSARSMWSAFSICQSMLANPLSTDPADVDRRAAVRQRNIDLNAQLAEACAAYAQCKFDNNAVFNTAFAASDVSTIDYFHPSIAGQAKLALVAWNASIFGP